MSKDEAQELADQWTSESRGICFFAETSSKTGLGVKDVVTRALVQLISKCEERGVLQPPLPEVPSSGVKCAVM